MALTEDHQLFRKTVRSFVEKEINPNVQAWEDAGIFPAHELFLKLGSLGFLGLEYDPAYGGEGADHFYMVVFGEELGRAHCFGVPMAISVQTQMATPSLHDHGTHELKTRYLAPALRGEMVCSIAVTEPDAGSDVSAITTRAERATDEWVINGTKLYITNGAQADWVCLLARTSGNTGYAGMSQILVPTNTAGLEISEPLKKLGNRSSDAVELVFNEVHVPVTNTIGEEGQGFQQQMKQFQRERMIVSYLAVGAMELAIERTVSYLKERRIFGGPIIDQQYVQFRMAELVAELELLRHYNYSYAEACIRGADTSRFAAIAKLKAGRLQREVADACIQFHGGIGYMEETWVSRFYRDSRLLSIGGGADEVMLQLISRDFIYKPHR